MILRRVGGWPWTARDPFEDFDRLRRQMDLLMEGMPLRFPREPRAGVYPLMNITEDKDNYYVRAELPGMNAEELDISVTGNSLSLSGQRKAEAEEEKVDYHRRERESGSFSRIINLPGQIDTGKVEAGCRDGILTVTLPKPESVKPRQIQVKTS